MRSFRAPLGMMLLLVGLLGGLTLLGCDKLPGSGTGTSAKVPPAAINGNVSANTSPNTIPTSAPPAVRDGETIRIATFNIQVFGTSKLAKPEVVDALVRIVHQFDVVAIQEVRAKDENLMGQFLRLVNANGAQYQFVVGPRLGRTSSKEQYAFLYDATRIEGVPNSAYTVPDPSDLLHREPLVTQFRVRGGGDRFTFSLVNIHTDPDETATELDALAPVFRSVQNNGSREDDVILLGDLNVDERKLGELGRLPGIAWVVPRDVMTNTRRNKCYDNIVFNAYSTIEYTGRWGVIDLQRDLNLSLDAALEISDHCPVWAEFAAREGESGRVLAGRPVETSR